MKLQLIDSEQNREFMIFLGCFDRLIPLPLKWRDTASKVWRRCLNGVEATPRKRCRDASKVARQNDDGKMKEICGKEGLLDRQK